MAPKREKAADEVFCRSCGAAIKQQAEICPECGVRNQAQRRQEKQGRGQGSPQTSANGAGASAPAGSPNGSGDTAAGEGPRGPSQARFQTDVSDSWWYGVVACTGLWVLLLALSGVLDQVGAAAGFLVLAAWFGLPVSVYFDVQYVRANSDWDPSTAIWVLACAIWFVNIPAGAIYLYRRHGALGVP